jgi:hypothetical protein
VGKKSISQSDTLRVVFVALLCVLLFALTLSAKLSVYRDRGSSCDPLTNTKLCLTGAKMDPQVPFTPVLALLLFALTALIAIPVRKIASAPALISVPPPQLEYMTERFLRPPPAFFPIQF